MGPAMLDTRTLNRALLARQLLLRRSRLDLPRAVERIGGIQAQYAPSAYIGLWSRLEGFARPKLTRALERGTLIQGTLMRITIHIVSRADYPILTEAVRQSRREWWRRVAGAAAQGVDDWSRVARLVTDALSDGPRERRELIAVLEEHGYGKEVWSGVGLWVDLVRVPPSGTWERRRADLYDLASNRVEMTPVDEDSALAHLARRYLGAFGPASVPDMSSWAGVPVGRLRPVLERLRLRRFVDVEGNELIDWPRQPIPDPDTPAPIRFLPTWDATLLTHARRTRILPEEYRELIFNTKNPQSESTFLVDGSVAGTWRHRDGQVRLEPFQPLPRRARRELENETERLSAFLV